MKILFVGNGINAVSKGYDWDKLMESLTTKFQVRSTLYEMKDSFPLAYEEIYLKHIKRSKGKEKDIRSFISSEIGKLEPNEIHSQILNSDVDEIITSNYDYTLQRSILDTTRGIKNESHTNETTYSLFRYNSSSGKKIWHMHGEINVPNSIVLGYEKYSGNLQKMRTYVTNGTSSLHKNLALKSLNQRLRLKNYEIHSWIDHMFSSEIHFVGLKLDFEETDLWWLITYRARRIAEKRVPDLKRNRLIYYIPDDFVKGNNSKLELLQASGVEIVPIISKHNLEYYRKVMKEVSKSTY